MVTAIHVEPHWLDPDRNVVSRTLDVAVIMLDFGAAVTILPLTRRRARRMLESEVVVAPESVAPLAFDRSRVRSSLLVTVRSGRTTSLRAYLLAESGRMVASLDESSWGAFAVERSAQDVEMTDLRADGPLTLAELRRRYPAVISWYSAEPALAIFLLLLAIVVGTWIALSIAFSIALSALTGALS
jgi:hypothetical protein